MVSAETLFDDRISEGEDPPLICQVDYDVALTPGQSGHDDIEIPRNSLNGEIASAMKGDAFPMVGEGFSGSVVEGGPGPISWSLGDTNVRHESGLIACLSPRIREVNFDNSGPHSADNSGPHSIYNSEPHLADNFEPHSTMVLTQMGIGAADRFESQRAVG
ncbi:hypothetical protein PVK06_001716 [Gossypium arboreum]|uniref:Uncharacterized protein n=1 Tax=Gossypium arboreum TaxID=29729 RepID=A0ABR0R209_GOSAR|nr:hypothetical protein PVK06_001716 [Gossypium arboreum]